MFGYVRPYKMELKLKDIHRYNELYCGLCQAIRSDFGQIYGCALSYDLTFLLAVLNGLSSDQCELVFRCPMHPFRKKTLNVSETALHYSAFINYFLMYLKVCDDAVDNRDLLKKLLQKILEKNKEYQEQYIAYIDKADRLKKKMDEFNELEKTPTDFDELSNSFGEFFSDIFTGFFEDISNSKNLISLQQLSFNLGKWIYLIDAYDDYLYDVKKDKFNLLRTMYFETDNPSMEQIHQRVQGIMALLIDGMNATLKEIPFASDSAIIGNIIEYGCNAQYMRIAKKRYPEYFGTGNKDCICH